MQTVALSHTRLELSIIGQGTWAMSSEGEPGDRALAALAAGIELGMTHLDTAEMYGAGRAERLVGRLFSEIGMSREQVVLASKVLPSNASHQGTLEACRRSMDRLGVESLDLYMLHWPGSHPIAETVGALEELVERGWTRAIGVSNFNRQQLEEALRCTTRHPITFNQVLYHLGERSIERSLLPFCQSEGILLVGYSPYGQGDFPRANSRGGRLLAEIGAAHEKTARQVALRFLTRGTGVVVIPKSETKEHVRENAGGQGWSLTEDEIGAIDAGFPLRGDGHSLRML